MKVYCSSALGLGVLLAVSLANAEPSVAPQKATELQAGQGKVFKTLNSKSKNKKSDCSCERREFKEDFESADVIFLGRLESFEKGTSATALVSEVFKGDISGKAQFNLEEKCSRFEKRKYGRVGRDYIYFAKRSGKKWHAPMCSRTSWVKAKRKALKKLRLWRDYPEKRNEGSRRQRSRSK